MGLGAFGLSAASAAPVVQGELKRSHAIQLTFTGPRTSETADPNPFRDYRLNVTFTNGSKSYVVPGYFAADGNAAETGATEGNLWRVNFVPEDAGTWTYSVSFRAGKDVAASIDPNEGSPVSIDGEKGTLKIAPDSTANGMLQYVGKHFLRYAGTGKYFVMAGTQSPENFLAYYQFDNTKDYRGA
jgi:hypothetical protein